MENKEIKDYKEERFEFTVYVNDNIICKRNFRIYNFIENSSRVYTWYYYNPQMPDETDEFHSPLIDPWACTFKLVISDNKRDVITKIWDGYAYPKYIREKVDLGNKTVKVTTKEGQTYAYDKDSFFKSNEDRLSFEHEVLRAMIIDKPDVLLQITKKICEACSPSKEEIKNSQKGYFDPKDNNKYLSNYTVIEEYGNDKKSGDPSKPKKYSYSLYLANKKMERDWERSVQRKTDKYFKNLY